MGTVQDVTEQVAQIQNQLEVLLVTVRTLCEVVPVDDEATTRATVEKIKAKEYASVAEAAFLMNCSDSHVRNLVEKANRLLRSPTQPSRINPTAARCGDPIAIVREVKRWDEVMMHIDQTALRDDRCLRKHRHEASSAGASQHSYAAMAKTHAGRAIFQELALRGRAAVPAVLHAALPLRAGPNAGIDRAGSIEPSIQVSRMKASLFPLRSNDSLCRPRIKQARRFISLLACKRPG